MHDCSGSNFQKQILTADKSHTMIIFVNLVFYLEFVAKIKTLIFDSLLINISLT